MGVVSGHLVLTLSVEVAAWAILGEIVGEKILVHDSYTPLLWFVSVCFWSVCGGEFVWVWSRFNLVNGVTAFCEWSGLDTKDAVGVPPRRGYEPNDRSGPYNSTTINTHKILV